jgi:hypothetical protein
MRRSGSAAAASRAARLAAAVRDRAVRVYPGEDGWPRWRRPCRPTVALACKNVLEAYAEECASPGDQRIKDQRMVDCRADLLLRPDASDRAPVQAQLTVVASVNTLTGGDEPGEVDGQPVPALLVRELAHTLGLLPRPEEAEAASGGSSGTPDAGADQTAGPPEIAVTGSRQPAEHGTAAPPPTASTTVRGFTADEAAAARLADLLNLRTAADTALAELPTVAVIDEVSGQLLALRSPAEIRRQATCTRRACAPTEPPAPTRRPAPASVHHRRPPDTGRRGAAAVRCAPATGAAASPAALPGPNAAPSTTTPPGPPGRPTATTSAACTATTTASATRPRAGPCAACLTAASNGAPPAAIG